MQGRSAAVLFSGGKDSTRTIELLDKSGLNIACLITVVSENPDSYMLHTSNIQISELCSQALGIPLVKGHTLGVKEDELRDIHEIVRKAKNRFEFDTLGCGAIASGYQRTRIEGLAEQLGLRTACPIWGIDQPSYIKEIVSEGYRFILTSVSAAGLDKNWLGKEVNFQNLHELISLAGKYHFNVAFEGGEAETLVLDCPLYKSQKLEILDTVTEWHGDYGRLKIKKIRLVPK